MAMVTSVKVFAYFSQKVSTQEAVLDVHVVPAFQNLVSPLSLIRLAMKVGLAQFVCKFRYSSDTFYTGKKVAVTLMFMVSNGLGIPYI